MNTKIKAMSYMTIPSNYITNYKIQWNKLNDDFNEIIKTDETYRCVTDIKFEDIHQLICRKIIITTARNRTGEFYLSFDIDKDNVSFLFSKSEKFDISTRINSVNDFITIMYDNI